MACLVNRSTYRLNLRFRSDGTTSETMGHDSNGTTSAHAYTGPTAKLPTVVNDWHLYSLVPFRRVISSFQTPPQTEEEMMHGPFTPLD